MLKYVFLVIRRSSEANLIQWKFGNAYILRDVKFPFSLLLSNTFREA